MEKIVVKLGGSVITYKRSKNFPTKIEEIKKNFEKYARVSVIQRLANELYEANNLPLILVNGAGPFGHYLVFNQKILERKEVIHESVEFLNEQLISYLKNLNVEVVSCAPFYTCAYLGDNKFCGYENIIECGYEVLEKGGILSTYGDIVPTAFGIRGNCEPYQVISGDDLMVHLAELWDADKIISVIDEEGLYKKDPKEDKNAELIKIVKSDEKLSLKTLPYIDVTGGMLEKMKKLQTWASRGKKAQLINGLKDEYLKKALMGDESIGTLILP